VDGGTLAFVQKEHSGEVVRIVLFGVEGALVLRFGLGERIAVMLGQ